VPNSIHGCFVDRLGNVFVAGNADAMVQKYSPVGTLLLRIGTRGKFDSVDGTRRGKGNNTACDQLHMPSDVIILSRPVMDELQKQDKVAAGPITNVVGTAVSVAARAGAPKPDVSSVDAFKRTLLATKSIVYADPAKDGASGVYFASVLDRLGIAEQMKPKTILVPGAQASDVVAKGEAELGVAQAFEIVPVTGRAIGGPAPRRVRTCDGLLRGG